MKLQFERVTHAPLIDVSASFERGVHVVLGNERDGTGTLIALAAGLNAPAVGRVGLAGLTASGHAALRAHIASVSAHESLPPGGTVRAALEFALLARAETRSALDVLSEAGLSQLAARRPASLSALEVRAVALALALSHPEPRLLALHEPCALIGLITENFLLDALHRHQNNDTLVLCSASRQEDAMRIGGTPSALERGIYLASAR